MKKLVISIVTWNSEESILACIRSVLLQSFTDYRLMIVDNNSSDNTCSLIESFRDPRIEVFKKNENTGFCGGHNFAIGNSESEFVLLVNPDIVMQTDYVAKAVATMTQDHKIGTVCGLLLQDNPTDSTAIIDSAGLDKKRSGIMRMRYHGVSRADNQPVKAEIFGADGALPLYRRAMMKDIAFNGEFFDELFFAHKEDWDISWRSHTYGWTTIFDPECLAVHPRHFKPESLKVRTKIASHIKIHSVKNQLILLLKNESMISFLRNCIFILPRQIIIFFYILAFERTSLSAYGFVFNNFDEIMLKRRAIMGRIK
jgi:GT2 family glycosyltransferase